MFCYKFYFYNFVTNKKQDSLSNYSIFQREKYEILEKVIFVEALKGLATIIQEQSQETEHKVEEKQNLYNNDIQ